MYILRFLVSPLIVEFGGYPQLFFFPLSLSFFVDSIKGQVPSRVGGANFYCVDVNEAVPQAQPQAPLSRGSSSTPC